MRIEDIHPGMVVRLITFGDLGAYQIHDFHHLGLVRQIDTRPGHGGYVQVLFRSTTGPGTMVRSMLPEELEEVVGL